MNQPARKEVKKANVIIVKVRNKDPKELPSAPINTESWPIVAQFELPSPITIQQNLIIYTKGTVTDATYVSPSTSSNPSTNTPNTVWLGLANNKTDLLVQVTDDVGNVSQLNFFTSRSITTAYMDQAIFLEQPISNFSISELLRTPNSVSVEFV